VSKVFNATAARIYGGTGDEYLMHVCVDGTAESVDALVRVIAAEAAAAGLFSDVSSTDATDPGHKNHDVAMRVERGYAGDPDMTDTVFEAKTGVPAGEVDERVGFAFFLPLVPFSANSVTKADELIERVRAETEVRCSATVHVLGPDVVDYVVAFKFERRDDQAERAHRALDLLYRLFSEAGFVPYRLDVDHAEWMDVFAVDPGARALAQRLKAVIDPNGVIAPGRYH
jgi:4-cresol dehydrogenase (hydroxylating)